jgi:hypothetical protein
MIEQVAHHTAVALKGSCVQRQKHGVAIGGHPRQIEVSAVCVQDTHELDTAKRCRTTDRRLTAEVTVRVDPQLQQPAQRATTVGLDGAEEQWQVLLKRLSEGVLLSGQSNVGALATDPEFA